MKKIISLILCFVLCLTLIGCGKDKENVPADGEVSSVADSSEENSSNVSSEESSESSSSEEASTVSTVSSAPKRPTVSPGFNPKDESKYYDIDFDAWNMVLVNPWNNVPSSFNSPISYIDPKYTPYPNSPKEYSFDARAIDMLYAMIEAAKYDGVSLMIISAYRTNDFQTYNFNRKVDRVLQAYPYLSREEAEIEAAKAVARPGTSEHQLGLAVDFNTTEDSFRYSAQYQWLIANCTDFGFILRYTGEKQSITGIMDEPWHYRYVGVENAKMIEASGLCFEEFVEKYNR